MEQPFLMEIRLWAVIWPSVVASELIRPGFEHKYHVGLELKVDNLLVRHGCCDGWRCQEELLGK
jgi:hypothetical protein